MRKRKNKRRRTIGALKLDDRLRTAMAGEHRWSQAPVREQCPTPWKYAYLDRKAAKAALKDVAHDAQRGRLHAYRCRCGRFHLGTASLKPGPAPELA